MANKPSLDDLYQKERPPLEGLYATMRNEDGFALDEVEAPVSPAEAVAERRRGRPDLLTEAGKHSNELNPLFELNLLGGALQKGESGYANTINEMMGNPVKGDTTNLEVGDVAAGMGIPDPMAATIGVVADPVAAVTKVGKVVDTIGAMANDVRAAITQAGIKATIPHTARVLFNKPVAETKHLVNNPDALSKANMSTEAPQKIGQEIARDVTAVQKKATRLYKKAAESSNVDLTPQASYMAGQELEGVLRSEADAAHLQRILNIPISKAAKTTTKVKQTYKPNFAFDETSGQIVVRPHLTQDLSASGVKKGVKEGTTETSVMTPMGPVTEKIVKTSDLVEQAGATVTPEATYTLKNIIDRAKNGQPINTSELVAARNALQAMRSESATAGRMADSLMDRLAEVDPNFAAANSAWRDFRRAEEHASELIGGIKKDYGAASKANRINAVTDGPNKMLRIFDTPGSPLDAAPSELDAILARHLKGQRNYDKRVRDIAAATGMDDVRPRLFGSTIGGGIAAGAGAIGYTTGAWAIPMLAVLGGTPRINTLIIRGLQTNKVVTPQGAKWLNSPAGKFAAYTWALSKTGAKNAARNAALRFSTGRNNFEDTEPIE